MKRRLDNGECRTENGELSPLATFIFPLSVIRFPLFVMLLMLLVSSCTSRKKLVSPMAHAANYEWMTAKMNGELKAENGELSAGNGFR